MDHYLDLEYFLSEVLFLCTANEFKTYSFLQDMNGNLSHLSDFMRRTRERTDFEKNKTCWWN